MLVFLEGHGHELYFPNKRKGARARAVTQQVKGFS